MNNGTVAHDKYFRHEIMTDRTFANSFARNVWISYVSPECKSFPSSVCRAVTLVMRAIDALEFKENIEIPRYCQADHTQDI